MARTKPEPKSQEHPIATAIGKTLGTIAKKAGVAAPQERPEKKQRLPRKLKKKLKKAGGL